MFTDSWGSRLTTNSPPHAGSPQEIFEVGRSPESNYAGRGINVDLVRDGGELSQVRVGGCCK